MLRAPIHMLVRRVVDWTLQRNVHFQIQVVPYAGHITKSHMSSPKTRPQSKQSPLNPTDVRCTIDDVSLHSDFLCAISLFSKDDQGDLGTTSHHACQKIRIQMVFNLNVGRRNGANKPIAILELRPIDGRSRQYGMNADHVIDSIAIFLNRNYTTLDYTRLQHFIIIIDDGVCCWIHSIFSGAPGSGMRQFGAATAKWTKSQWKKITALWWSHFWTRSVSIDWHSAYEFVRDCVSARCGLCDVYE